MRTWVRSSTKIALLTAGFVAMGTGISLADTLPNAEGATSERGELAVTEEIKETLGHVERTTDGLTPVVDTQNTIPNPNRDGGVLARPVDSALSLAQEGESTATVPMRHSGGGHAAEVMTSGNGSAVGGNQLVADLDAPANASGNAVAAVLGVSGATSEDVGAVVVTQRKDIETSGNGSAVGGNQGVVDVDTPVNVAGNAVGAVAGVAGAAAEDTGAAVGGR
ncbi:hypothetical protein [Salinactinospora qingdaonensis]|uniref:Chaplin domain-containing protein n=1 Tax=Salinactinospora qingdaonensis TaxID=702744 RepID=A0ABP7G592_9ACTN